MVICPFGICQLWQILQFNLFHSFQSFYISGCNRLLWPMLHTISKCDLWQHWIYLVIIFNTESVTSLMSLLKTYSFWKTFYCYHSTSFQHISSVLLLSSLFSSSFLYCWVFYSFLILLLFSVSDCILPQSWNILILSWPCKALCNFLLKSVV